MKTSKFNKLANAKATGLVNESRKALLTTSTVRTGKSGYSKGWASKSVWTDGVSLLLTSLNIQHVCGNDAPKGGAKGEYVTITDKAFLKAQKAHIEAVRIAAEKAKAEAEARRKAIIDSLPNISDFEAVWYNKEAKEASGMSWNEYRHHLKQANPDKWQILKAKFIAGQTANV